VAAWRDRYGPWAVVTGASAGIGKSFARQLAERGLDLILVARREPLLEALAKELSARHGVAVRPLVADLSDARGLDRLVADTASVEVGLLVNNAGAPAFHGHFVQRQRAEVEALVDFNTRVQAVLAHHFLQPMARRRRGGLIQVASVTGHVSMPFMVEYSASKAYQLAMGEALYSEMRHWGVDCLVLAPGATVSERIHFGMPAEAVVRCALAALGHQPSVIPGLANRLRMFRLRQLRLRRGMVRACGAFQYRQLRTRPWQVDGKGQ